MTASGAVNGTMGQAAEEWTDAELRRLRRHGWRTISHLTFRPARDIDHIAVGPDGVIVVETKWTSAAVDLARSGTSFEDALRNTKRSERDVAGHLGWGARADARIIAVVVVWVPEVRQGGDEPIQTHNGVLLVAGTNLRRVLGDLGESKLTADEIDRIYAKFTNQIEYRCSADLAREGTRWLTLRQRANRWLLNVVVGSIGMLVALQTTRWELWFYLAAAAALLALGLVALRWEDVRRYALGWIVGTQLVTLMVGVFVVWQLLTS